MLKFYASHGTCCFSIALLFLAGCASDLGNLPKTVKAEGVLTLDGSPVDGGTVVFIADSGNYHATGTSDAQGKFALRAFPEKEGAVPGSYKIEITKTVQQSAGGKEGEGANVTLSHGLPEKYASFATSGLSFTIPDSGTSDIKMELKSK